MKKTAKKSQSSLAKAASQIKVGKRLDIAQELPPFIKKKLKEAERIISITGLPK